MRRTIQNAKFMMQNIGSKLFIFHSSFFIPAKQATLPLLDFVSSDSYDMKGREELSYLLLRNSLIIAKGKEIGSE